MGGGQAKKSKCEKSDDPVDCRFYFNVCGSQMFSDLSPVGFCLYGGFASQPFHAVVFSLCLAVYDGLTRRSLQKRSLKKASSLSLK